MTKRSPRMLRKLVVAAVAVTVFLVTPYFVYDRLFAFQFGEAEMRAAVEGTWTVELAPREGPARSVTFTIEQARGPAHSSRERGWVRAASACGHRTFIRSAEACKDFSEMGLKLVAIAGDRAEELSGSLRVVGTSFDRGSLELQIDRSYVSATVSSAGEVLDTSMVEGKARLVRVRPRS